MRLVASMLECLLSNGEEKSEGQKETIGARSRLESATGRLFLVQLLLPLLLLLLQCCLVPSISLTSYSSEAIDSLALYGNELASAYYYLTLTNGTFDESGYLSKFYGCYSQHRHKTGPLCMNDLNTVYFKDARIWKGNKRREPDCTYQVKFVGVSLRKNYQVDSSSSSSSSKRDWIQYDFVIEQSKCLSLVDIPGGSSFIMTAFDDAHLRSCTYTDNRNGTYSVGCYFPVPVMEKSTVSSSDTSAHCMNLTVMLDYEHYDEYSDGLPGLTSKHYRGYYELRYLTLDNTQYCAPLQIETASQGFKPPSQSSRFVLHPRTRYITGEWLSEPVHQQLSKVDDSSQQWPEFYRYPNETMFSGFQHREITGQLSRMALGNLSHDKTLPEIARSVSARQFSANYDHFRPIVLQSSLVSASESNQPTQSFTLSPYDQTMTYHFIGASHMRYIFDAIVAHLLTEEALSDVKAHHGDVVKHNMRNYHSNMDYASILSDDQADLLRSICSGFSTSNPLTNHTIIFQTGAWDLNNSPIRRFLHDANTGVKLAAALRDILTKPDVCPQLRHFVWVTTVPHPVCFNEDEPLCQDHKGYRTNAAISALIQYYNEMLMSLTVREGLTLTIVDSYSIILPRLLLHPDTESSCLSHYHCRVKIYEEDPSKTKLILAHTPSGIAVVQSVLTSLTTPS